MEFRAQIEVSTKEGVLNPESRAVLQALNAHNFAISSLTLTKKFYVSLEADSKEGALKLLEGACEELLANPVIQDYEIKIEEMDSKKPDSKEAGASW